MSTNNNGIMRKLPVIPILKEREASPLKRRLTALDLTLMGIGAVVGSGVFVMAGVAAADRAGPALILSFIIAGIAVVCAALCYSELGAAIPTAGGAYTYTYISMGEMLGWFIGWCLVLEYIMAMSAISTGWSAYCNMLLSSIGINLPGSLLSDPFSAGHLAINLPAIVIITLLGLMQIKGIKESARLNAVFVFIKLAVIVLFIVLIATKLNVKNFSPFMPYGWSGVFSGAAFVFFAYLGFDCLANAAEETVEPQKNLPKGIIGAILTATVIYIVATIFLTGAVPYYEYHNQAAPVAFALSKVGIQWGAALVSVGTICGLTTGVLVIFGAISRLLFSMSRDGMIGKALGKTRNGVPHLAIIIVWAAGCILAGLLPIGTLGELVNIGTFWAFLLVSISVLVLRKTMPDLKRGFRVPLGPVLPIVAIALCAFLMVQLAHITWIAFLIWTAVGAVIYFTYGKNHSTLKKKIEAGTENEAVIEGETKE